MQPNPEVRWEIERCSPALRQYCAEMQAENERLTSQNTELQARINQDFTNSSQPSSASSFVKPQNLRTKTGRKPGVHNAYVFGTIRNYLFILFFDKLVKGKVMHTLPFEFFKFD
jgi:hypothetical protein